MTEPSRDTWERDRQVLEAVAPLLDADTIGAGVRFVEAAQATGLSEEDVLRAAHALESDGLVECAWMTHGAGKFVDLTGDGRRGARMWPTPESGFDRMIAALEAISDDTHQSEETRSRARRVLEGIGGAGRDLGVAVVAAIITGQIPGAGS